MAQVVSPATGQLHRAAVGHVGHPCPRPEVDGILMLALPPAPAPARPRLLMIATTLVAGAAFLLVVSLPSIYLDLRHEPGGDTSLWLSSKVRPSIEVGNI